MGTLLRRRHGAHQAPRGGELRIELIEPDGDVIAVQNPHGLPGADIDRTYRRLVDTEGDYTLRITDTVPNTVRGYLDGWKIYGFYEEA